MTARWVCARCRRGLASPPTLVQGLGYGPTCAGLVGGVVGELFAQPAKRQEPKARIHTHVRRRKSAGPQADLFPENHPEGLQ